MVTQTQQPQPQADTQQLITAHAEYKLLNDIADIEKRILEQLGEEMRIIAPRLRQMNMFPHLEHMQGQIKDGLPHFDAATQELRYRLKKREQSNKSTTKEKLLGWLGFNA